MGKMDGFGHRRIGENESPATWELGRQTKASEKYAFFHVSHGMHSGTTLERITIIENLTVGQTTRRLLQKEMLLELVPWYEEVYGNRPVHPVGVASGIRLVG